MLKIFPTVEYSAQCPKDGQLLQISNSVIPGMRCLGDGICSTCGTSYYVDLPVGQALWSPIALEQKTAEVYATHSMSWFSEPLRESFLNPVQSDIVPIVHQFFESDQIIILNCLDFLYGHSLLKLLNVQRYLDHHADLGCCVLVPTQLKHLVPDGVAEIWEFPVPIKDGWKWYPSLQRWIDKQIVSRKECYLSPAYSHPSNQIYDLNRFARDLPDIAAEIQSHQPIILFSYREDRLWGSNLAHQQRNLQTLYDQLSTVFPKMAFVLVGFGQANQINPNQSKLIDLRVTKFDVDCDRLWMAYMKAAACAVGIHGSNMLLPSGLAKSTVELVPKSRLGNTVQAFLFASHVKDCRDALLNYRMLYGNETLANIHPSAVVDLIATCLAPSVMNSSWFKVGETTAKFEPNAIQQEPVFCQALSYLQAPVKKPFHQKLATTLLGLITSQAR